MSVCPIVCFDLLLLQISPLLGKKNRNYFANNPIYIQCNFIFMLCILNRSFQVAILSKLARKGIFSLKETGYLFLHFFFSFVYLIILFLYIIVETYRKYLINKYFNFKKKYEEKKRKKKNTIFTNISCCKLMRWQIKI